jgi:LCP family protein required for cell wall assembly
VLRGVLLAFAAVLLAAGVVAGASYWWLSCKVEGAQIDDPALSSAFESTPTANISTPTGVDILLMGIDRQPTNQGEYIRSDSLMVIHADPDANYLSLLSLPRDLRVEVPGHGTQKLNAAYTLGGAGLAVSTVKELTGVNITKYVEVDFQAFRDLTDEVGGVYIDVDKRYLNPDPKFELIDLWPGYQLVEGDDALDYVRYRIDGNLDFGRMERQQRFFTALREQALGWDLTFKLPGLVNALLDNIKMTLGTNEIIQLAYWAVTGLDGSRIRQVTLNNCTNQVIDGVWYVIPAEGALEKAVDDFITPPTAAPASTTTVATEPTTGTTEEVTGTTEGETHADTTTSTAGQGSDFITDPDKIADSKTWHDVASKAPFQVLAPGYLPEGYDLVDQYPPKGFRSYDIRVGDEVEKAQKFVYQLTKNGEPVDQYMGIMETTWLEAPAASPGREVEVNGTVYTVVGTSKSIDHVWWIKDGVLYWVSNTLSYLLHSSELLKVAESMIEVQSGASP